MDDGLAQLVSRLTLGVMLERGYLVAKWQEGLSGLGDFGIIPGIEPPQDEADGVFHDIWTMVRKVT